LGNPCHRREGASVRKAGCVEFKFRPRSGCLSTKKLAVLSSNLDQSLANNKSYSGCLRRPQSGWATHATDEREPASEKLAVLSSNFDQGLAVCQQKKLAVLSSNLDQSLANNKSYSGCLRRPQSGWATHATDEREPAIEKLAVLSSNFDQGLAVCQKKLAVLT
jgi:hypothetical protein